MLRCLINGNVRGCELEEASAPLFGALSATSWPGQRHSSAFAPNPGRNLLAKGKLQGIVAACRRLPVTRRPDPFMMALQSLKSRVESGAFAPGASIVIIDEARRLKLSPTPIREALAWLCGRGLIERAPMGGYLMRGLDPARVRDEMSFRLLCLKISLNGASQVHGLGRRQVPAGDPVQALRDQMIRAVQGTGNGALVEAFLWVSSLLAQLAVAEQRLFEDLDAEAAAIVALFDAPPGSGLPEALAAYHQRRIETAALLVVEADAGRTMPGD